ncbi:hypothetical protein EY653_09705 [Enterococcus faecalis]|nr:hypothetical protein [Enterococcus faecalis]MBO6454148.1 hypothetical protein [Enterococcus faecalis]
MALVISMTILVSLWLIQSQKQVVKVPVKIERNRNN